MLNPIEPPWYVTRMPGGVTGTARKGLPMSILQLKSYSCSKQKMRSNKSLSRKNGLAGLWDILVLLVFKQQ